MGYIHQETGSFHSDCGRCARTQNVSEAVQRAPSWRDVFEWIAGVTPVGDESALLENIEVPDRVTGKNEGSKLDALGCCYSGAFRQIALEGPATGSRIPAMMCPKLCEAIS